MSNAPTTHLNGSSGAFDPGQGDWKERAMQTLQRPLPPKMDRAEYEKLVRLAIETGNAKAVFFVNKTAEFQERVEAPQPGIETAGNENTSPQPVASTGKSESVANASSSSNGTQAHTEPSKDSKPSPKASPKEAPDREPKENSTKPETDVPDGYYRNRIDLLVPGSPPTKASRKEEIEKAKDKLKKAKALVKALKRRKNAEEAVTKQEAEVERLEEELKVYTDAMLALPPEVSPDESQPWCGKIYANTTGYLVRNSEGDYQFTNETNTGRVLREMGISNKPDTATTSPLDRVFNILHDRHHVDHYLALAGHPPGLLDIPGKRVLITKVRN